jgi:hypothetical protein
MTSHDQWVTSVHEAGHALAYYCFGWQFEYISIKPRENSLGHICGRIPAGDPRYSVICLAGPLAQAKFTGEDLFTTLTTGGKGDVRLALDALDNDPMSLDAAIAYTRQLVDLRWSQIELISRHLVRRQSLTYDRAVSLLWYFS